MKDLRSRSDRIKRRRSSQACLKSPLLDCSRPTVREKLSSKSTLRLREINCSRLQEFLSPLLHLRLRTQNSLSKSLLQRSWKWTVSPLQRWWEWTASLRISPSEKMNHRCTYKRLMRMFLARQMIRNRYLALIWLAVLMKLIKKLKASTKISLIKTVIIWTIRDSKQSISNHQKFQSMKGNI